ncbi:hypothetical protein [Saccharopolyspora sp. 6V]|uniref:hypothetical protein n=1 Tax=Saccharopolyspora sp. 6V TaxID=2877239 RepID=UPI001CD7F905|nr:hypothetical protein [Saccharopolyspora sp. 6V]MCA1191607.1 hypothetical protein [Saccharopolyspora sp. 6V]
MTSSTFGWWGGLPIPPGVGNNTGWAPPASWDSEAGGLVDENGNLVTPEDPPATEMPGSGDDTEEPEPTEPEEPESDTEG